MSYQRKLEGFNTAHTHEQILQSLLTSAFKAEDNKLCKTGSCALKSSIYFKRVSFWSLWHIIVGRQCEKFPDTLDGGAVSFCFSESVEETQNLSCEVANESARVC